MPDLGDLLRLGGALAVMAAVYWVLSGGPWKRRRAKVVSDEPEGAPYRIYTREFDRDVRGREIPDLQDEADRGSRQGVPPAIASWPDRIIAAEQLIAADDPARTMAGERLDAALGDLAQPPAIMLLVDQSGSMRDRMIHVAATLRWFSTLAGRHNVALGIAGFTTVGWRGGAARRLWLDSGRPKRPGRLCSLLHIRYQDFGGALADEDWHALLHPDVLRENVDGEAIEWASALLAARPEPVKLLIVLSDGAAVDDSTLTDNGASLLHRHVLEVIGRIEAAREIRLGAVGIAYRVHEYYSISDEAIELAQLPAALASVTTRLLEGPA